MERLEQFQCVKVDQLTLFTVRKSVTFDFGFHATFHKLMIIIDEVLSKIAQKCEKHIYGES